MTGAPDEDVNPPGDSPVQEPERMVCEALMMELVKLRKKRKIGQEPIAQAIGITQGRVSQIESLKTGASLEAVLLYARAIGANIVVVPTDGKKKVGK